MDNRFDQVCNTPGDYPHTLVRPLRPHEYHERNHRQERLESERDDLFDHTEQKVDFWEVGQDNNFVQNEFRTIDQMKAHLFDKKSDPQIRHVFLRSSDSRSPIDCHADLAKTLFTYHQVEPSFLDAIHAFGEQYDPKDLCLMDFRSHDTLAVRKDKLAAIPKLNRSGREIHLSYLLRSMEPKTSTEWKWQIRQAAIYHSFDTETGKSFWCTVKGNDEFNKRVKQSSRFLGLPTASPDPGNNQTPKTAVADYFAATLATHLVYLSWCDDHWRDFVNDIEEGIREPLEMARGTPIDDHLEASTAPKQKAYPRSLRDTLTRNSTMRSSKTPGGTGKASQANSKRNTGLSASGRPGTLQKRSTLDVIEGVGNALLSYLKVGGASRQKVSDPEKDAAGPPTAAGGLDPVDECPSRTSEEPLVDPRIALSKFRICHVQRLYTFSDRIRRAILTLTLNISVLEELHEYFKERLLNGDLDAFRHIKDGCRENGDALGEFLREVKSLTKRLETRRTQLECLGVLLAEGNSLYDGILQYRQLDISTRFQETGRISADHMQVMANKTRVETASMHVITVVTMIFLPATFVATLWLLWRHLIPWIKTFFQSGVFLWNNDSPGQVDVMEQTGESYKYRADGFILFVAVSVPLMVITVGIWLYVFLNMRKSMRVGDEAGHTEFSPESGKKGVFVD